MVGFNKVILMGNLTRDPELRYIPSGTAVATLRLAVNNRYRQGDEWKDDVCYVDVTVWGKQAENCNEFLSKGSGVLVEGRLSYRTWETEEGQTRSKHEVVANTVRFLPKGRDLEAQGAEEPPAQGEGDVPF
jgi:single-strand DNA-binding protein